MYFFTNINEKNSQIKKRIMAKRLFLAVVSLRSLVKLGLCLLFVFGDLKLQILTKVIETIKSKIVLKAADTFS